MIFTGGRGYGYASSFNCSSESWKTIDVFKFWHYFLFSFHSLATSQFFKHITEHISEFFLLWSINVDFWRSNQIDRTFSCVPDYQRSIIRSFSRILCNLPPVCCLFVVLKFFSKCNIIHSNVFLDILKCLLIFSGKYLGISISTYPSILLISSLTLKKLS